MGHRILLTADGSTTLRSEALNETYHSTHGAMRESVHVFITAGLDARPLQEDFEILEIGLGTGLNALLAATWAEEHNLKGRMTSIEKFPLGEDIRSLLDFPGISSEMITLLHQSPWEVPFALSPFLFLEKIQTDFLTTDFTGGCFDVIFYDAFSPTVQPEMWNEDCFFKAFKWLKPGGTLVTYCAKGAVRRTMQQVGFIVERLPGPPGKREMLRATKPFAPHEH